MADWKIKGWIHVKQETPKIGERCLVVDCGDGPPMVDIRTWRGVGPSTLHPGTNTDGWGRSGSMHVRIDWWLPMPSIEWEK